MAADRMLNFRAPEGLHELIDRAVEMAGVDKSRWLRIVIEQAAKRELTTHRLEPVPVQQRGVYR
jgi:antitoxin component of RelBE/YafQ-DinJ toxin-antitoxin module